MPQRRPNANTKLPTASSPRMNTESCPNSFLVSNDAEERDVLRNRRNRRFESSPIGETQQAEKSTSAAALNGPKIQASSNTPEFYLKLKAAPQSSSERMKSYCQPNDSVFRQYTLMTYSSGAMASSLYPNYNVSVPYVQPRYSTYSLQSSVGPSAGQLQAQDKKAHSTAYQAQSFPSFFNPRTASNMPHKEKVNNWIENIPIFEVENGIWRSDCYDTNYSVNWEESEFDDAAKADTISFVTHDELLYLQAKKFDSLVRKSYGSESEPKSSQRDILLDNPTLTDYI
ncbi:hypothetical protein HG536_0A00740 [Torulaspora globosa]|uniref:Uncharacterized protein n=1 Tax=Torulaspora globosa TaxID=48254 RepID=A0A7G3Z9S1_9SACH|nr:uncharacterized protein HG536_0A00740 [Torulaspora globosa]QLL30257.1 hypothetical protein HG536_0A00740 [Torulaspora globosa]